MNDYDEFLSNKAQDIRYHGFDPIFMPDAAFDFQQSLIEWSLRKGRAAIFADCGLGKTLIELAWAENVVRKTNKPVLILTPLAVAQQTIREGQKFGIEANRAPDGKHKGGIVVANYERLHYFDPNDFAGVVCDESGCIKHFGGRTQSDVTDFLRKMPYRLLATATPSPNDYIELGTSSEALGEIGRQDLLATYFTNDENSSHPVFWGARWRFKAHAERAFWRFVCSWARAARKPSDVGPFDDGKYKLPKLILNETIVTNRSGFNGQLFPLPAITLDDQREERRITLKERCDEVALKCEGKSSSIVWAQLNVETDRLEKIIPGAKQVSGSDTDESKEEVFQAFIDGQVRVLVTKSSIAGFGLNMQHCSHMTFFPSHSFESYHQSVRRCWRFGQKNPVTVDIVTTEGEQNVMKNLSSKSIAADAMYDVLVREMNNELKVARKTEASATITVPSWLNGAH